MSALSFYALNDAAFRLELNTSFKSDIVGDLYWSINLFESYNSQPPARQKKNDFGVSASRGLVVFIRGALPLGLPYWFARGGPKAPLRSPGATRYRSRFRRTRYRSRFRAPRFARFRRPAPGALGQPGRPWLIRWRSLRSRAHRTTLVP